MKLSWPSKWHAAFVALTLLVGVFANPADVDGQTWSGNSAAETDLGVVCEVSVLGDLSVKISVSSLGDAMFLVLRDASVMVGTIRASGSVIDRHPEAGPHSYTAQQLPSGPVHSCGESVDVPLFGCTVSNSQGGTPHALWSYREGSRFHEDYWWGPAVLVTMHAAGINATPPSAAVSRVDPATGVSDPIGTTATGAVEYLDDVPDIWFWSELGVIGDVAYSADFGQGPIDCGQVRQFFQACWPVFNEDFTEAVIHINPELVDADPPVLSVWRVSGGGVLLDDFDPNQLEYVDPNVPQDANPDAPAPYFYYFLRTEPDVTKQGGHLCKWQALFSEELF